MKPIFHFMPKATLTSLIAALCFASYNANANDKALIKNWECKLSVQSFEIDYDIKLNADDTYFSEMRVMTVSTTEEGNWRTEGDTLYLKPSKTIQRGEAMQSREEYERKIVDVSDVKLVLNHDDAVGEPIETVCGVE